MWPARGKAKRRSASGGISQVSSIEPADFFCQPPQCLDFSLSLDFFHDAVDARHLCIEAQSRLCELLENLHVERETFRVLFGDIILGQLYIKVTKIQDIAIVILTLPVLGDELAERQNSNMVAVGQAKSVDLHKSHLGAVDFLLFHPRQILEARALMFLDQLV